MVIDDLKLIREVKIRPYFYVKGLTGYRNSTLRKKGWEQIGGIFETTGEECCTRWRVIRDRYVKLIAKKGAKKPLTGYDKNWTLYKHLGFLKAHIKPRTYKFKQSTANGEAEQEVDEHEFIQNISYEDTFDEDLTKYESSVEAEESLMSIPDMDCNDDLPIEITTAEPYAQSTVPDVTPQCSEFQEKFSAFTKRVEFLLKQRLTNASDDKNEAFYRMIGVKLAELPEDEQEDAKLHIISHVFERVKTYKQKTRSLNSTHN
ncbi:PREDICTED: transcription factor Adf-1-like [Bactrocera latifrons]|uniref:MADF domain-containing protein n=1 Tax=Bactrocera latifrons TaxID=174628 RepID=A0A0K8VXH7_BACLA|nr:PREDICTED: transcription factor Adf-1-like [Bactrocera latifrons]